MILIQCNAGVQFFLDVIKSEKVIKKIGTLRIKTKCEFSTKIHCWLSKRRWRKGSKRRGIKPDLVWSQTKIWKGMQGTMEVATRPLSLTADAFQKSNKMHKRYEKVPWRTKVEDWNGKWRTCNTQRWILLIMQLSVVQIKVPSPEMGLILKLLQYQLRCSWKTRWTV